MMSDRVLLMLLKVFRRKSWAKDFLNGRLYCNTVKYYRDLEDGDEKKDKDEGAVVIPGDKLSELKIGDHVVSHLDVVEIRHYPNLTSGANVFCMFCWAPRREGNQVFLNKEEQLGSLREFDRKYGPYAVMIGNLPEFFRRIDAAVNRERILWARGDIVKYELEDSIPNNREALLDLAFHKNPEYSSENEYRFAFLVDQKEPGPYRLNIGDIRDIATLQRTDEIYDSLKVNGSTDF